MFQKYQTEIAVLKPLELGCTFFYNKWSRHFDNQSYLHNVLIYNEKYISRQTVIEAFKTYYSDTSEDITTPFLLTMIWGFENTGYGPHRTNNYLSLPSNMDLIAQALENVATNNIESAFCNFQKIKGLGVSYVSKLLYFASRAMDFPDYSLIFDIRVANGLLHICSDGILSSMLTVIPSSKYGGYLAYNQFMHTSAKEINVTAEQLEYFLFNQQF